LKFTKNIALLLTLQFCVTIAFSQEGKNLLPLSNKLLLNPSFAGWDKNTTVQTGNYFISESKEELNHVFYLTYDSYSEKLKGGFGYYFFQELYGIDNINETGVGFSYARPISRGKGKRFIPSFNINYKMATKQWFAHTMNPLSAPGQNFFRYNVILPKAGIIWDSPNRQIGLSLAYSINIEITDEGEPPRKNMPEVVLYYSQLIEGNQNGLTSRPYEIIPEVTILYSGEIILTRAGIQFSEVEKAYGFFIQNNFSKNLHGIGGIYGWKFSNFSINLSAGSAYSIDNKSISFFGEVSLALLVPYIKFDKKNPWSTPKKLF
jgi:hypothetical protein